ncbi:serine hydrolase domain-containing protein (plasmid) [Pseudoalteromonas sp. T1lg65]|uniref:serine hydrolase domain-containing protein n=1 Tax=Pseudoalteromonas sp. T1lg65 TaxID=2077101 RepID=UPI003F79EB92
MNINTKVFILFFVWVMQFGSVACGFELTKLANEHLLTYQQQHQFQGAVLIAKEGKVLFSEAYGFADREDKKNNALDTQFLIGSLTKSFTAVAIMRLFDAGKLDLKKPLSAYLPALESNKATALTLHHLLKHQSGLAVHLERLTSFEQKDVSSKEILEIINQSPLHFTPGTQYQYSNLNYHLAALVIEKVTDKTYSEAMSELVFKPLNMQHSGVERMASPPDNRANGYRKGLFGINRDENIVSYALGSGDIYSTVYDLLTWQQALTKPGFLTQNSLRLLFTPASEAFGNYGYGFRIQPYQRAENSRGQVIRHGGSMDGFLTNLHYYQDDQLTVIVLANIRNFPIRQLTFELKELALGFSPGTRSRDELE